MKKLANDPNIKLNGQSGSKQVPFGVQIQNTRGQPVKVGLFLYKLRFKSYLQKIQVEELLSLVELDGGK